MQEKFKVLTILEEKMKMLDYNISTMAKRRLQIIRIHPLETYEAIENLELSILHNSIYNNYVCILYVGVRLYFIVYITFYIML